MFEILIKFQLINEFEESLEQFKNIKVTIIKDIFQHNLVIKLFINERTGNYRFCTQMKAMIYDLKKFFFNNQA